VPQSCWTDVADRFEGHFPFGAADRGARYFEDGRVALRDVEDGYACARVRGTRQYRVEIRLDESGRAVLDCDCPGGAQGLCKHMFATLLELQDRAGGSTASWERELAHLGLPPPADPWARVAGAAHRPLFVLCCGATRDEGSPVIRPMVRKPLKSGGWSVPKALPNGERYLDPKGRELYRRVRDAVKHTHYYRDQWLLHGPDVRELLLDLAQAGVLHLGELGRKPDPEPLRLDTGSPYEFRLELDRGQTARLHGSLVRGDERVSIQEPDVVLAYGLMIFDDALAEIELGGGWHWLAHLRRTGPIEVPPEGYPLLVELVVAHGGPIEHLFPRSEPPPVRPVLRLEAAPHRGYGYAPSSVGADVDFQYGDAVVPAESPAEHAFNPVEGAIMRRDGEAESAHLARLLELGGEPAHGATSHTTALPAKRALSIVASLMREGWLVEGDGEEWHTAESWDFEVTTGIDWFELRGGLRFGDQSATLPEILQAVRSGESVVRLEDGSRGVLPEDLEKRLGLAFDLARAGGDGLRFTRSQGWLLDTLLEEIEGEVEADSAFREVRRRAAEFSRIEPRDAPRGFRGELRPYQRDALGWLSFLEKLGLGGCLADDMGLGKTVMVLAHLRHRRLGEKKPALVVAPKSLIWNWIEEARKFAPTLRVLDYAGPKSARDPARIPEHDLVVTTYGVLRRDAPALKDVPLSYAILDEAQAVKNPSSQAWKAARLLRADHRLALTGTPVENHLGDLWAILEFLNPGMLGSRSTHASWARANGDEAGLRKRVARLVKPVVLRRTKEAVLKDLPPRQETRLHCEMGPKQKRAYEELRDHYRSILLGRVDEEGMAASRMHVLEALLRLRQCACHPGLLDGERTAQPSAKFETLVPMLEEVRDAGRKALVFSQFTSLLSILKEKLDATGLSYAYLDGRTRRREDVVRGFIEAPDVPLFLISLKAGGVGLNLTAADHVFLLDPWWNPAVERQAVDRTHRIGQERTVNVYRLVTKGTVEERILELQERKRELAEAVVGADSGLLRKLTRDDLEALLGG